MEGRRGRRPSRYEVLMREVNITKSTLIEIVKRNRRDHASLYTELVKKYKEKAIEALEERLMAFRGDVNATLHFNVEKPQNAVSEYDRVIRMLELSSDDTIKLSANEFSQYVEDKWHFNQALLRQSASLGFSNDVTTKYNSAFNEADLD